MRLSLVVTWFVTLVGLWLGCVGILELPSCSAIPWLCASVALDAIDGSVARALGTCTRAGAKLDWTIDTMISYAIVYRMAPQMPLAAVSCACALVAIQTFASATDRRFSGRTAVTILCGALLWWTT